MADDDTAVALGELGAGLLDAGYAVTDVEQLLRTVAAAHGRIDLAIGVLPGAAMIDDPRTPGVRLTNATGEQLTSTRSPRWRAWQGRRSRTGHRWPRSAACSSRSGRSRPGTRNPLQCWAVA